MNVKQLFDLTGRVAIITGGAAGLGLQMAEALSEMGANLVLCARKKDRCEQAAKEFTAKGVKTLALSCDVRNPASIQEVVDRSVAEFGQIDILTQGGPLKRTNVLTYFIVQTLQQDNNDGKAAVLAVALFGITFVLTLVQLRVLEKRVHYGR